MSILVKLQVLAVFSFRLPLIALAGAFLKTWIGSLSSNNPGIDRSLAILLQQTQLCVSLMAGTIPCLKSFLRSFDTGSGVKAGFGSSNGYGSSGHSGSNMQNHTESFKLSSLNRSKSGTPLDPSRTIDDDDDDYYGVMKVNSRPFPNIRSNPSLNRDMSTTTALRQQEEEPDRGSQGSGRELFIRKDLEWEVASDVRRASDTPGMLKLPK